MFNPVGFTIICIFISFLSVKTLHSVKVESQNSLSFFESRQQISGKVLRVVVLHYPPAMIIEKTIDGTFTYKGVVFEMLDYMAKALDISYEKVFVKEEDAKQYGIGPAQLKLILEDKADLVAAGIISSHEKYQLFDFTIPFGIQNYNLLVPWPREESRLIAPLHPFELPVWLCLAGILVAFATVLACLTGLYKRYIKNNLIKDDISRNSTKIIDFNSFIKTHMFLWAHLTKNRCNFTFTSRASYIAVGIWCLMTVVLANAYAGNLLSFLSVPKLEPVINSLKELAHSKKFQLLIQAQSEISFRFLNSTNGVEKIIGDSLRANPDNLFYDPRQVIKKLMTGKYALVQLNTINRGLMDTTYRENKRKCKLTLAKESITMFSPLVQVLPKHGPYTKIISETVQQQVDAGITIHLLRKYQPNVARCLMENQKKSAHHNSLSLVDMSSAFVILGLGISLSGFIFVLELVIHKMFN